MLAFVLAMGVTVALIPALVRVAGRLRVLDAPGPRKIHAQPMPRVGGIAMAAGVVAALVLWLPGDAALLAYLSASLVLLAFGVWDDRSTLGYLPKFAGQLAAASIVVAWGGVLIHSVTLTDRVELPAAVAVPLTMAFLVGITNAINLADGLDGLAGGTTLLSCCAIALLALTMNDRFVATIAIVTAGSILGFLRYNTYPARIFMGDGGSQFLGFTVAVIAILLTQSESAPISAALPLLLLGLPILDTLMVMVQRMAGGRSPFSADRSHIHHRLLGLGFDHHEAVIVVYLLQGILFLIAWYMRYESDLRILLWFGAYATAVLGFIHVAARTGWRWRRADWRAASGGGIQSPGLRLIRERLPGWAFRAVAIGTMAYVVFVVLIAAPADADIGWLSAILAVLLAALAVISANRPSAKRPVSDWMPHAMLYVGVAVFVYLDMSSAHERVPPALELLATSLLAASVMLYFRMTTVRRFQLTPLDFLVIFVALTLPNLPGSVAAPRELGLGAVKVLVLFYAVEMLLGHSAGSRWASQAFAAVTFGVVAYRALT